MRKKKIVEINKIINTVTDIAIMFSFATKNDGRKIKSNKEVRI